MKLLTLAKPENCYIWRLSDVAHLDNWVSESGKVVMVGDAVHAMLPAVGKVSFVALLICRVLCSPDHTRSRAGTHFQNVLLNLRHCSSSSC
jgi:hypothetical protein